MDSRGLSPSEYGRLSRVLFKVVKAIAEWNPMELFHIAIFILYLRQNPLTRMIVSFVQIYSEEVNTNTLPRNLCHFPLSFFSCTICFILRNVQCFVKQAYAFET